MVARGLHRLGGLVYESIFALVFPLFISLPVIADMDWGKHDLNGLMVLSHWAVYLGLGVVVFLVLRWEYRRIGGTKGWMISKRGLAWSLLAGIALYGAAALLLAVAKYAHIFYQPGDTGTASSNVPLLRGPLGVLTVVASSIGSPILEELGFRGVILTKFERLTNRPIAAILAALFFVIAHLPGIIAGLSMFIFALVNTWLDRRYDSLVPGMVSHITYNVIVSLSVLATAVL